MKTSSAKASPSSHSLVSLVQGTLVEGTVEAESDIRVDGTIKGKLFCQSKVIIGPSGHIEGEIYCENAVIEGSLKGLIEVNDLLNVRETARIQGRVQTEKLIVQSGAVFNVKCQMGQMKTEDVETDEVLPGEKLDNLEPSATDIQAVEKEKQPST